MAVLSRLDGGLSFFPSSPKPKGVISVTIPDFSGANTGTVSPAVNNGKFATTTIVGYTAPICWFFDTNAITGNLDLVAEGMIVFRYIINGQIAGGTTIYANGSSSSAFASGAWGTFKTKVTVYVEVAPN